MAADSRNNESEYKTFEQSLRQVDRLDDLQDGIDIFRNRDVQLAANHQQAADNASNIRNDRQAG